jgi:hypothetical protein
MYRPAEQSMGGLHYFIRAISKTCSEWQRMPITYTLLWMRYIQKPRRLIQNSKCWSNHQCEFKIQTLILNFEFWMRLLHDVSLFGLCALGGMGLVYHSPNVGSHVWQYIQSYYVGGSYVFNDGWTAFPDLSSKGAVSNDDMTIPRVHLS